MGSVSSKSQLERRNTVLRRSQRRTIASLKPRIEDVYKNIRKLKETEPGPQSEGILSEIARLEGELKKRGVHLQPQIVVMHEAFAKKLIVAKEMLNVKLEENNSRASEKKEKKNKVKVEEGSEDAKVQESSEHKTKVEMESLENAENKRHTVELKLVKVVPEEAGDVTEADDHNGVVQLRTPEERRRSILRQGGVAVMPGAMLNEITHQSNRISRQYDQSVVHEAPEDMLKSINDTIEQLQELELHISEFVGEKNGKHYNKIRDVLNKHLVNLNLMNPTEEDAVEQVKICKNYVGSCLNFLDEKAVESTNVNVGKSVTYNDEVFESDSSIKSGDINNYQKLRKLTKNTSV